jgi:alkylhydroperoxidase family enzyme
MANEGQVFHGSSSGFQLYDERARAGPTRHPLFFPPEERAALALTEALPQIAPVGISDELYAEVSEQFSDKELSTLVFRVMGINA